ncbi:XRE family transcriptional regulator [Mucilaginibacter sp.]|uniref:XRE family transcriptional regulator n=1 Tax=Mucilaginibacter sp. TaxID=1882438 RepID=UPI003569EC9C
MAVDNSKERDMGFSKEAVEKLATRIQSIRKLKGYDNYERFAYDHNIPRAQFGRYEKGQDLQFTSLVKVVKAFDMTLVEFFSEGFDNLT